MNLDNVKINQTAEQAVVAIIANLFESSAFIDTDTLRRNIQCGCAGGSSRADRTIRADLADYLMSNFGVIFIGLLINKDFRDTFMESIAIENVIDDKNPEIIAKIRDDMKVGEQKSSAGDYVVDFSKYDDAMFKSINGMLLQSFKRVDNYSEQIDVFIDNLTEDDMIDIGYCVSNFMYLIRAFSQNGLFANYVKRVIHNAKDLLDIE